MNQLLTFFNLSNEIFSMKKIKYASAFLLVLTGVLTVTSCKKNKVVPEKEVNVESVAINPATLTLNEGETGTLKVVFSPENSTKKDLTWTSSDVKVATVDQAGKVTAIKDGVATITATSLVGGKKSSCEVTVKEVLMLEKVSVSAGKFMMGVKLATEIGRQNDEILHEVTLSKGFKMSKTQITNKQYCVFLNANKIVADGQFNGKEMVKSSSAQEGGKYDWGVNWNGTKWVPAAGKEEFPVIYVTWSGASEFAKWAGGDLPTEAQWEFACRSGLDAKPFGISTGTSLMKDDANYGWTSYYANGGLQNYPAGTASSGTQKVATYAANSFGLYDMHGNVGEWCKDWYGALTADAVTDPTGSTTGTYRVVRGGSWRSNVMVCRSAFRNTPLVAVSYAPKPDESNNCTGFRIVLPL